MIHLLHFADAHIDIANYGRRDPASGLPLRVLDFLKALDTIIDHAIDHKMDLVIFAGDAYKDRSPAPTFQREWGRRIIRLSQAGIETILLVGNHDLSPSIGRANALQEYDTLQVPHVHVAGTPHLYLPEELNGLPVQVMALPWINRSNIMATLQLSGSDLPHIHEEIEERLRDMTADWFDHLDPNLPAILTAHGSVQGAVYGGERSIMLGNDMIIPRSLVVDPRLDYVALGHIHKPQDLNEDGHPHVIYPGSIERVNFGEVKDEKFFITARVEPGNTQIEWHRLKGRPFVDRQVSLSSQVDGDNPEPAALTERILSALPAREDLAEVILRLTIEYPREWEALIDENAIRDYAEPAFDFHLGRKPLLDARIRLPDNDTLSSAAPMELLGLYWDTLHLNETGELDRLAQEIIASVSQPAGEIVTEPDA